MNSGYIVLVCLAGTSGLVLCREGTEIGEHCVPRKLDWWACAYSASLESVTIWHGQPSLFLINKVGLSTCGEVLESCLFLARCPQKNLFPNPEYKEDLAAITSH